MERRYPPVKIVDTLWGQAVKMVQPPQLAIVIVSEADGVCAFRHNCVAGTPDFARVLHQFASQLEAGEGRGVLSEAQPSMSVDQLEAKIGELNQGMQLLLAERDKTVEALTEALSLRRPGRDDAPP